MLNVREKLIDLVKRAIIELDYGDAATKIADHLIANGVTVQINGDDAAYIETKPNDFCSYAERKENT